MKTVFIIGPKHSGKTSAGRALASLCSGGFIDLDELIAERTGKSPRSLFTEGPSVFRTAEAEALAAFFNSGNPVPQRPAPEHGTPPNLRPADAILVLAAGGGITDNPEAVALLEKTEQTIPVYLNVSADTAWKRINASAGGTLPPFLQTENPRETHRALHERRAAACRKLALITIEAERKNPKTIAREIWDRLGKS